MSSLHPNQPAGDLPSAAFSPSSGTGAAQAADSSAKPDAATQAGAAPYSGEAAVQATDEPAAQANDESAGEAEVPARYSRHVLFKPVGENGQRALGRAR
ncbi:thiazole biosynthesis adenylyltransferase ThiF, partial [Paenibacillus chitinolyticus]|nr:thiazole biosynthesis adenylyltransferase ThiF [Paenibacillus chitinolyticus]